MSKSTQLCSCSWACENMTFLLYRTRVRRRRTPWESFAFASSAWTFALVKAVTDWPGLLRCWSSSRGRHPCSLRVSKTTFLTIDSICGCWQGIWQDLAWLYELECMGNLRIESVIFLFFFSPLHCTILRYPQKWKDCCPLYCPWSQSRGNPGERT